jgi:hypothetical protein
MTDVGKSPRMFLLTEAEIKAIIKDAFLDGRACGGYGVNQAYSDRKKRNTTRRIIRHIVGCKYASED